VVEFAILLPILMFLFMGTIDIGLAFNAGRQAEDTLRAAARLGAADGIKRPADYTVLRAIAAQNGGAGLGQPEGKIDRVVIYKATGTGEVPVACWTGSVADLCNSYQGSILDTLVSPAGFTNPNCAGDLDAAWCPTARRAAFDEGANLGVAIRVTRKPLLGEWNGESLGVSEITRRVVFRMEVRTES
jgi:hypothetical protein